MILGTSVAMHCPVCGGSMVGVAYDAPLKVLEDRKWNVCRDCGYQKDVNKWKKAVFTI